MKSKKKKEKQNIPWGIWLIIGLTTVVGICLIGTFFFILHVGVILGEKIEFTDLLMMLVTVIGGFFGLIGGAVGVIGAYLVFTSQVRVDKINKLEEKEKELEYKKLMLFNLLDYTILKTNDIYRELNADYEVAYRSGLRLPTAEGYENEIIGNLHNDCTRISSLRNTEIVRVFLANLNVSLNDRYLREYNLYEHIYDANWTSYLDCIQDIDKETYIQNTQRITNWIIFLQNSKVDSYNFKQIDALEFIMIRRGIDGVIEELAPEIKLNGFRSKMHLSDQEIRRPQGLHT